MRGTYLFPDIVDYAKFFHRLLKSFSGDFRWQIGQSYVAQTYACRTDTDLGRFTICMFVECMDISEVKERCCLLGCNEIYKYLPFNDVY